MKRISLALAFSLCLPLLVGVCGCNLLHHHHPGPWVESPARWYAIGEQLGTSANPAEACPFTLYLIKAYSGWRDPVLDAPPDGTPPPWCNLTFATVGFEHISGVLGKTDVPATRYHEWCTAPAWETKRAEWERQYLRDDAGEYVMPLVWALIQPGLPQPPCEIIVYDFEPGVRALIGLRKRPHLNWFERW